LACQLKERNSYILTLRIVPYRLRYGLQKLAEIKAYLNPGVKVKVKEAYWDNGSGNRSSNFMLYPNKEHQQLYLQIAAVGGDFTEITIKDSDKDVVLKEVEVIKAEDGLITIEVNIGGVSELYVSGSVKSDGAIFVPLTTSYYK
jgi:hypothetical protein